MNRRSFVAGAIALSFASAGCAKKRKASPATYGGLDCLELVHPEPDPTLPVLVALHANGGAPEHWVDGFSKFPGRARVVLPRSFTPSGWFAWPSPHDLAGEKLAADVAAAEDRLARGLAALAAGRPLAVCGYVEGAMLSLVLARRPELVLGAFSVAGACPPALYPKARAAPVVAYHGGADDVLRIDAARATIAAYKSAGGAALLREYAGVGHDPSDRMHADLDADIVRGLGGVMPPSDQARSPGG